MVYAETHLTFRKSLLSIAIREEVYAETQLGFRRVAYLGYAGTPGVTRH